MQLSFLCAKHSNWVYSHPQEAINFLARDEIQGMTLFYDGEFRESIPYLGCAFDITAILLDIDEGLSPPLIDKFCAVAGLLCDAYRALGLIDYIIAVQSRVAETLNALQVKEVALEQAMYPPTIRRRCH